ncbi:MAG: endonuclease MutS2 [Clostridiales bacterium]|nr:endonuclease MutS2 [Clostridiales bacterium]
MDTANRHYKALELNKVLAMLADRTSNDDSRALALNLKPEHDIGLAQALLNQTEAAHRLLARFGGPSFGGLRNVNNALSRADAGSTLSMRELMDISEVLRVMRSLVEWRSRNSGDETCIDILFGSITPNKYLEEKINSAIISEDEMSDSASPELYDIRRKIRVQESSVREKLDKIIRSAQYSKFLQDNIVTQRNGRYVVPVKSENRSEIAGLVHDTSSSGATVFIEPMGVVEANNEIRVLKSRERDEIERILSELSVEAGSFADDIKAGYECAVELNLIFSKAQLAYAMKASAPILNNRGVINLKKARHPLIDPASVVATDISLGRDFDTLVITGPNTGGKTVAIKTIGLLTLMAMCGLMIPAADRSELSVFNEVLADIGDEQSIEQSLSTFSSHMTNIVNILGVSDEHSLVLIDELGAGTDPVEGAALAMAILEKLFEKGAKVAATTHYAELKAYALQTYRVENACCEFDVNTLKPTYRLLIGVPGRSNAFAISERLGISSDIIERARALVSTENIRFEDVVDSLEKSRIDMERERELAEKFKAEAQAEKAQAQSYKDDMQKLRESELEKARGEALRVVERARREADVLMNQIESLKKETKSAKDMAELARRARSQIKQGLNSIGEVIDPVVDAQTEDEDYVLPRPLELGDTVFCRLIGKNATVTGIADKSGKVEISAGMLKMRANISSLRLVSGAKKESEKSPAASRNTGTESRVNIDVNTRCDLRGMTVDEALLDLDTFIDNTVMAGLKEITIIHGKGTGALRTAVQKHLRAHPQIRTYRLGTYGEGENGVTIAELK